MPRIRDVASLYASATRLQLSLHHIRILVQSRIDQIATTWQASSTIKPEQSPQRPLKQTVHHLPKQPERTTKTRLVFNHGWRNSTSITALLPHNITTSQDHNKNTNNHEVVPKPSPTSHPKITQQPSSNAPSAQPIFPISSSTVPQAQVKPPQSSPSPNNSSALTSSAPVSSNSTHLTNAASASCAPRSKISLASS